MPAETRTFVKNNTHGSCRMIDGSAVAVIIALAYENGDLEAGPFGNGGILNEVVDADRRGKHVSESYGGRIYPTFSFTAKVCQFSDDTVATVTDFVNKANKYSGNTSTRGAGTNVPYLIDFHYHIEGSDGGGQDSDLYFADCAITIEKFSEGDTEDTVQISGVCKGKVYRASSRDATKILAQEIA